MSEPRKYCKHSWLWGSIVGILLSDVPSENPDALVSSPKNIPHLSEVLLICQWLRSCMACLLLLTKSLAFLEGRPQILKAWNWNLRRASQAEGTKSWKVRRHLRDHLIDLLLYTGENWDPATWLQVQKWNPLPVLFIHLHYCLPGHAVSLTLDRSKADPSEKSRGSPQPRNWVLLTGMICSSGGSRRGWLHCLLPFGTGPAWSALSGSSVPRPQKADLCLFQSSLWHVFNKYLLMFSLLVPFPLFFLVPFLEVDTFREKWINKLHSYNSIFEEH